MKFLLVLSFALLTARPSMAAEYECADVQSGNIARLSVTSSAVLWFEDFHSASSRSDRVGIEGAPYSEWKGYLRFRLTDFWRTNDSAHLLALSPNIVRQESLGKVVTYFDNDGHDEEITRYFCTQQK